MEGGLTKSSSLPGLLRLGTSPPNARATNTKKATFAYHSSDPTSGKVDKFNGAPPSDQIIRVASMLKNPSWRLLATKDAPRTGPAIDETPGVHKNMVWPRVAPSWLKHDKQVLRFYAYFQEAVTERADENSRYRHCVIMYCMEDGTVRISEPKVENSGLAQGQFLKRHRVQKEDQTFLGPGDLRVGEDIVIYARKYHITGADRFTRWFYEQNDIELEPDEPVVEDLWEKNYKFTKTAERGDLAKSRNVVEAKRLNAYQTGIPPAGRALTQFLENDRKVLRFKGYWDDISLYGARIYLICHYYLADNTMELNEAHCRNSGRDNFPVFYRRGPLNKENRINAYPGMLEPDGVRYLPEDLLVGDCFYCWGRKIVIYDCDDFTRDFYHTYMSIDQGANTLDVSDVPLTHVTLPPPPHNGVGPEEDALLNVFNLRPKPPKQDLVRLMTLSGEIMRFEAKMVNGQPEDEIRKLIIGFFPADDQVAVWEIPVRNSGIMGGKFMEKSRCKNPATNEPFKLSDLAVGKTVVIRSQPLLITRADEHTLQWTEANTHLFPYADPVLCCKRLEPIAEYLQDPEGIEPDLLKDMADHCGIDMIDHEIITLLRFFNMETADGQPRIHGQKVVQTMGMQ